MARSRHSSRTRPRRRMPASLKASPSPKTARFGARPLVIGMSLNLSVRGRPSSPQLAGFGAANLRRSGAVHAFFFWDTEADTFSSWGQWLCETQITRRKFGSRGSHRHSWSLMNRPQPRGDSGATTACHLRRGRARGTFPTQTQRLSHQKNANSLNRLMPEVRSRRPSSLQLSVP